MKEPPPWITGSLLKVQELAGVALCTCTGNCFDSKGGSTKNCCAAFAEIRRTKDPFTRGWVFPCRHNSR